MGDVREKAIEAAVEAFLGSEKTRSTFQRRMSDAIDAYEAVMRKSRDAVYQSHKPCLKCGSVDRYRSNNNCAPCARRQAIKWRDDNLEISRQSARDRQRQRTEEKRGIPKPPE